MGAPLYQEKTNKHTGEKAWFTSHDDGASWEPSSAPAPVAAAPEPAPVPDAAPVPPPAVSAPAAATDSEIPWYEVLGRGARDTAGMGLSDEFAGFGAKLAGPDIERTAGRGSNAPVDPNATAYAAERDAQRAEDARALKESPTLYRTGEAIGLGGTAAAPFSKFGKAAPAVLGAANAFGSSKNNATEHPIALARDTAVGGATGHVGGMLLGGAVEEAAPYLSRALGEASGRSMESANKHYLRASGARKPDLDRVSDRGDVARLAEGGRRLGIGKGFIPQTVDTYADDASRVVQEKAAERAALEDAINAKDAVVNPDALEGAILKQQSNYAPGGSEGQPLRDELATIGREQRRMAPIGPPTAAGDVPGIPWSTANLERKTWGKTTKFQPGTPRQELRQGVYGAMNEALEQGAEQAVPGSGSKWRQAGEDQHIALELRDMAAQRDNANTTNRLISPSDYGAGATTFIATGEPGTTAAVVAANKVARGREPAIREAFARNKSRLQGAMGRGFAAPAVPAVAGQTAARPAGAVAGPAAGDLSVLLGNAARADSSDDATPERRTANARGQMLPDAAMQLYKQQPQAFGKWQKQLFDARQQGEGQFAALLTRLQADPEFQQTVLPKLQAMTSATAEARR